MTECITCPVCGSECVMTTSFLRDTHQLTCTECEYKTGETHTQEMAFLYHSINIQFMTEKENIDAL